MPDRDNPSNFGQSPLPQTGVKTLSEYRLEQLELRVNQEIRDLRIQSEKNSTSMENRIDREMRDLRSLIEKTAALPDRDLRELRAYVDRRDTELQKGFEEEAKEIRAETNGKFGKIWNFGFWAFTTVATPILGYAATLFFKNLK